MAETVFIIVFGIATLIGSIGGICYQKGQEDTLNAVKAGKIEEVEAQVQRNKELKAEVRAEINDARETKDFPQTEDR